MANFFDQFDTPESKAGGNFFDQFDTPQKTETNRVTGQLPGPLGSLSLVGMAKGLYGAAKSAATLPGEVYAGKVDPLSQEGIGRAAELASLGSPLSAGRTLAAGAAAKALAPEELRAASRPVFKELTEAGNKIAVNGEDIAKGITADLDPLALRQANARRTYQELRGLGKAEDLNDVAIARDKLRDVANGISENRLIRVTGNDSTAARRAMHGLDTEIEKASPGWTAKMAEADANWAAARRMETVQKEAEKGRLGSFGSNESRAKGFTKEEIAAVRRAHQGGLTGTLLNSIGALSPFHGGLSGAIGTAIQLPAAIATKGLSLLGAIPAGITADIAAKGFRDRALRQALEKISARSPLANSLARNPGIIQLPQIGISPTLGILPFTGRQ